MDGGLMQFPVLSFNSLAARVLECTGQKIKLSDLSIGTKVDGIICHCLFDFYGISLNPSERPFYVLTLMKKFEQMNFPESFACSDFAEKRDEKKMLRLLSWLFQFFEALAPANEYAFNVWNSYKEKASHAAALKNKIASLRVANKTEEEKRSEYQKNIVELRSSLSKLLTSKRKIDEHVTSESRKLSLLTESEKSHTLEASSLGKKLDELQARLEVLRPQVIDNPSHLPMKVKELKEKQNALELEMQDIRAKTFQVDQSIDDFKRLHKVIEQQLVSVAKACHSLLLRMSQSQTDLEKLNKELLERSTSIELLVKKVTDVNEKLRISEHGIVNIKVLEATQTANDDRIKKEKAALLDKYCFAFKSLESDLISMEALLKTTKTLNEDEYSNKKRDADWALIEELKEILQRLFQAYVQSQDQWLFSDDS